MDEHRKTRKRANNDVDDEKDNHNIVYDNPNCSLPDCAHHDLEDMDDKTSRQTDNLLFLRVNAGEEARSQPSKYMVVSPKQFLSHCPSGFDMSMDDKPVYQLDPFTMGAYVNEFVLNEKMLLTHSVTKTLIGLLVMFLTPDDRCKGILTWNAV